MPWLLRRHNLKGAEAEQSALRHLKRQGLKLVSANFACRFGELDLVMKDGSTLVFIGQQLGRLRDIVVLVRVATADDDQIVEQTRTEELLV